MDRSIEQSGSSSESVVLTGREQCHFRVSRWFLEQEVTCGAVRVRCPEQGFSGADTVSSSESLLANLRHPLGGGLPSLMPAGLITLPDLAGGGQDLTQVGPTIGGETCGAHGLEGERLVAKQEFHG